MNKRITPKHLLTWIFIYLKGAALSDSVLSELK